MNDYSEIHWNKILDHNGVLKYEGFTVYNDSSKEFQPCGQGVKYFNNGTKHMEGYFDDWFIETGIEYYENGNIKFIGEYNKGPRTYYGPRYFVFGRLFDESGTLWYEGTFDFKKNGVGYPIFEKENSFKKGKEYNNDGSIKKIYGDRIFSSGVVSGITKARCGVLLSLCCHNFRPGLINNG